MVEVAQDHREERLQSGGAGPYGGRRGIHKKKKITLMIYTQYQDQSDKDQWTRTINVP